MIYQINEPFPWAKYSKTLKRKILAPKYAGVIRKEDLPEGQLRLVVGEEGSLDKGEILPA